jgi:hypothetical protein
VIGGEGEVTEETVEKIVGVMRAYRAAFVPSAPFPLRIVLLDEEGKVAEEWRRS